MGVLIIIFFLVTLINSLIGFKILGICVNTLLQIDMSNFFCLKGIFCAHPTLKLEFLSFSQTLFAALICKLKGSKP